jgi:kynurenine formamidase
MALVGTTTDAVAAQPKRWRKGVGWGWVWGPQDEVGNLNELSPELALQAMRLVKTGKVYDLGLTYSRESVRWPGHAPGEILTFRSPQGVQTQKDLAFAVDPEANSSNAKWTSGMLSMSDNVSTQLDAFAHFYEGTPPHAYNGFLADDIVGDFGALKLGAETIPPIVAPATLIDVAKFVGQDPLPQNFEVTPQILQKALQAQKVDIDPLDVVMLRYGVAGLWVKGKGVGANHAELNVANSAGINVDAARWLVEEKGALIVGADDVDVEYGGPNLQPVPGGKTSFNPVHNYLLVQQGVHIAEFHYLDQLAADGVYKFAYMLGVNKIKGTTCGTVQRPIGIA